MNGLRSSVLDVWYQKGNNEVFLSDIKNYGYTYMAKKTPQNLLYKVS